ncbi:MAG: DUF2125 domain-containing protein [Sphingomonadales bacterium]
MRFRIFIGILLVLTMAYVVYWFVVADRAHDEVLARIDEQRALGAAIAYDELSVRGFPYRLEIVAEGVDVSREEGSGIEWRVMSPEFIVVMQPWKFTHAIAFAEDIRLSVAEGGPATILDLVDMRASVVTDRAFAPMRVAAEFASLAAATSREADDPDTLHAARIQLNWHRPGDRKSPALAVGVPGTKAAATDGAISEPIASEWALQVHDLTHPTLEDMPYGPVIDSVAIQLQVHGEPGRGLDRDALAAWRDAGGSIDIPEFRVLWDGLDLAIDGTVTVDEQFRPLGALVARLSGYGPVIDHLRDTGYIDDQEAETVRATLRAMSGGDETEAVNVPLAMQSGRLFLGPLPMADLPPLVK